MKAFLLYADADFDFTVEPWNAQELRDDLGLDTVVDAMSGDDEYLRTVNRAVLLSPVTDVETIRYRQDILDDCLATPELVHQIYELSVETIAAERNVFGGLMRHPSTILTRSLDVLDIFVDALKRLRKIADEHAPAVRSAGLSRMLRMLQEELQPDYFDLIESYLKQTRSRRHGVLISARLGAGNKGVDYVLRDPSHQREPLLTRLTGRGEPSYSFTIPPRDDAGLRALGELQDRGLNQVANALAQSVDHILSFFGMLRAETGFYLGCVRLHERLVAKGEPVCRPRMRRLGERVYRVTGLYEVALSLRNEERVVGNDVSAEGKELVIITGANTGGKSTFLRSVGIAQLMAQAGMFVGAESFEANVCAGIETHYKREEDASMTSGKFDEELARLSQIADHIGTNHLLLSNESFSSTNEAEGSEIGRQIWHALLACGVQIFFVTHLFDFADSLRRSDGDVSLFLRAERQEGGQRSFRLAVGDPLPTSYGPDLFDRIFTVDNPQPSRVPEPSRSEAEGG